jgi:hypothetical protein
MMLDQLNIGFDLTREEQAILACIHKGKQNAWQVRSLAGATGLKHVEVRQIVRHLIMDHGVLIASSMGNPAGFYIPETAEEVAEATRSLRHRGIMILVRAAKLQKLSLEEIFHQGKIEFGGTE